jgi:hypothetical protein
MKTTNIHLQSNLMNQVVIQFHFSEDYPSTERNISSHATQNGCDRQVWTTYEGHPPDLIELEMLMRPA